MTHRAVTVALLASMLMTSCGGDKSSPRTVSGSNHRTRAATARLAFHMAGRLPAPVQLPSTVAMPGGEALAIGGLDAQDTSTDRIVLVGPSGAARTVGRLPAPLHDSAAASIGGRAYLFGGGDLASSADVLRISNNGHASSAGELPSAASDVAAATSGSTAYIVGGYTGTAPLRSLLAFSPGHRARPAAMLPRPLRYAAVAAVGPFVLIAGGTSGTAAQRAILRFDTRTRRVTTLANLPHSLTHAAGASLGGRFYVIGGRGEAVDSATAAIWSVDPSTGSVEPAGRLPVALSDLGAASEPDRIFVMGGRDSGGRVHDQILTTRDAR